MRNGNYYCIFINDYEETAWQCLASSPTGCILVVPTVPMAMPPADGWHAGVAVRIIGLAKAPQHNGKEGAISTKVGPDGRVGVELGIGKTMAVRRANLELVKAPPNEASGQALEAEALAAAKAKTAARREEVVAQVAAARAAQAAMETVEAVQEKLGGAKKKGVTFDLNVAVAPTPAPPVQASEPTFEQAAATRARVVAARAAAVVRASKDRSPRVNSDPSWATILLDGTQLGSTTASAQPSPAPPPPPPQEPTWLEMLLNPKRADTPPTDETLTLVGADVRAAWRQ